MQAHRGRHGCASPCLGPPESWWLSRDDSTHAVWFFLREATHQTDGPHLLEAGTLGLPEESCSAHCPSGGPWEVALQLIPPDLLFLTVPRSPVFLQLCVVWAAFVGAQLPSLTGLTDRRREALRRFCPCRCRVPTVLQGAERSSGTRDCQHMLSIRHAAATLVRFRAQVPGLPTAAQRTVNERARCCARCHPRGLPLVLEMRIPRLGAADITGV